MAVSKRSPLQCSRQYYPTINFNPHPSTSKCHLNLKHCPIPAKENSRSSIMHAKFAYILLAALSTLASTSPVEPVVHSSELESNATASVVGENAQAKQLSVKLCTDPGWGGICITKYAPQRDCIGKFSEFNDRISAFGPEKGQRCTIYKDDGCKGDYFTNIRYPGYSNLKTIGFDNQMSSYDCVFD